MKLTNEVPAITEDTIIKTATPAIQATAPIPKSTTIATIITTIAQIGKAAVVVIIVITPAIAATIADIATIIAPVITTPTNASPNVFKNALISNSPPPYTLIL